MHQGVGERPRRLQQEAQQPQQGPPQHAKRPQHRSRRGPSSCPCPRRQPSRYLRQRAPKSATASSSAAARQKWAEESLKLCRRGVPQERPAEQPRRARRRPSAPAPPRCGATEPQRQNVARHRARPQSAQPGPQPGQPREGQRRPASPESELQRQLHLQLRRLAEPCQAKEKWGHRQKLEPSDYYFLILKTTTV